MNMSTILPKTIHDLSIKSPDAPAILAPGKQNITYHELQHHLRQIGLYLTHLGFESGERIAVVLPNGSEMATSFLAVSSVCGCAPLNPSYHLEEYVFSLKDLHIKAVVTSFGMDHPVRKAARQCNIPVIFLEPDKNIAGLFSLRSDMSPINNLPEPILANPENTALILHTSGTTARPKIVPLTHNNIRYSVQNITDTYHLSSSDRCLNVMPLFHIHGLIGALSASLAAGASIICTPGYNAENILKWFADLSPTWYSAVPTIHQSILEQVRFDPQSVGKMHLRFIRSSSSSLPPQVGKDLEEIIKAPVLEAYGMTEATHQMASNPLPPKSRKFGSVGPATGTTQIVILDENGEKLPQNTSGEICIRGGNVMGGYENNPSANKAVFTNGWMRTGDKGYLDNEGYLYIQSRIKEIINRGGEKISPREVDEALLSHPAVQQAVTFAVPHPRLGEDIAAAVVLRDGESLSGRELRKFIAAQLADFKVPRRIVFLKEIPKGATGKIQRIGLAEKLKDELAVLHDHDSLASDSASTPVEVVLLSIWRKVLSLQEIGIHDDFLDLGGDSLQSARLLSQVNETFGLNMTISDVFDTPTISSMAILIESLRENLSK